MKEFDNDNKKRRSQALARLAVLERLKEHALAGDRATMFRSIQDLIEVERRALPKQEQPDSESGS